MKKSFLSLPLISTDQLLDPFPDLVLPNSSLNTNLDESISANNYNSRSTPLTSSTHHDSSFPNESSDHNSANQSNNPSTDVIATPAFNMRRSQRPTRLPRYLQDFHCNLLSQRVDPNLHSPHHVNHFISYNRFSKCHRNFVLNVSSHLEPQFFHQAITVPQWREAMKVELDVMDLKKTWSVVPLPAGKHSIGCR